MVDTRDLKSLAGNSIPVRVRSPAPSWSANFDDTAPNAVSSKLSELFQLGKLFIFPLMTNSVFERVNCTHKNGQEEKQESKKQDKSGF